ncbi:OmpA family protein [Falsiroseomonas sp. CW058]|uniref:OmpA family protein n=1 Tax=Falsiroseomonas sp. CW058 TaxID=3388664 RepID=UPI003D31608C
MTRRLLLLAAAGLLATLPGPAAAQAPRGAPAPPLALPAGMSPLPAGADRVSFRPGDSALPAGAAPVLGEIGRRLAAATPTGGGRITVEAQASGPSNDASAARRIALARAQAVRAALVAGGIEETRVDVRALGRTPQALDAADVLPPGVARAGATR